jgi:hypothetical protein
VAGAEALEAVAGAVVIGTMQPVFPDGKELDMVCLPGEVL